MTKFIDIVFGLKCLRVLILIPWVSVSNYLFEEHYWIGIYFDLVQENRMFKKM